MSALLACLRLTQVTARSGSLPSLILCSTALRARQTLAGLTPELRIVGTSLEQLDHQAFADFALEACVEFSARKFSKKQMDDMHGNYITPNLVRIISNSQCN